jgi:hypothetical protein
MPGAVRLFATLLSDVPRARRLFATVLRLDGAAAVGPFAMAGSGRTALLVGGGLGIPSLRGIWWDSCGQEAPADPHP